MKLCALEKLSLQQWKFLGRKPCRGKNAERLLSVLLTNHCFSKEENIGSLEELSAVENIFWPFSDSLLHPREVCSTAMVDKMKVKEPKIEVSASPWRENWRLRCSCWWDWYMRCINRKPSTFTAFQDSLCLLVPFAFQGEEGKECCCGLCLKAADILLDQNIFSVFGNQETRSSIWAIFRK